MAAHEVTIQTRELRENKLHSGDIHHFVVLGIVTH